MTVDLYTKAVLTVIAFCLLWLAFGGPSVVPTVRAQGSERVVLTGWMDVNGTVRLFPPAPNVPRPEAGKPVAPASLPIWLENR